MNPSNTQYPVLITRYPVPSTQYLILNTRYLLPGTQYQILDIIPSPATPFLKKITEMDSVSRFLVGQLRTNCNYLIYKKIDNKILSDTLSDLVRSCPKVVWSSDNFGQKWPCFTPLSESHIPVLQRVNPFVRLVRSVRTHFTVIGSSQKKNITGSYHLHSKSFTKKSNQS